MASYVGPATVEWTDGEAERRLEVSCYAESRAGQSVGHAWDGYLVDRLGILVGLARVARLVQLRTPHGVGEIRFSPTPRPWVGVMYGAPPGSALFKGSGEAPF